VYQLSALYFNKVFLDQNGIGEGAIDLGGPSREFLQLVMKCIPKMPIFQLTTSGAVLCRNAIGEQILFSDAIMLIATHVLQKQTENILLLYELVRLG
jgi:hypothetical protein